MGRKGERGIGSCCFLPVYLSADLSIPLFTCFPISLFTCFPVYFDNVKFERIKRVLAKSKGELAKRSRFQGLKEAMSLDLRERVRLSRCLTTSSAAC